MKQELIAVRELLSDPVRWTQLAFARREDGTSVNPTAEDACKWCLDGALWQVSQDGHLPTRAILNKLAEERGFFSFLDFNDSSKTTHDALMGLLDEAIVRVSSTTE